MFKNKFFWQGYAVGAILGSVLIGYVIYIAQNHITPQEIKKLEQLQFVTLKADTLSLRQIKTKHIYLNYWTTHCPPCIKEMPLLLEFSKKNSNISMWLLTPESIDTIKSFVKKHPEFKGLNFAHIPKNKETALGNRTLTPTSYIADSSGKVLWVQVGMLSYKNEEEMINDLIKKIPALKQ